MTVSWNSGAELIANAPKILEFVNGALTGVSVELDDKMYNVVSFSFNDAIDSPPQADAVFSALLSPV